MTIDTQGGPSLRDHGRRIPWRIVAPALAIGIAVGVRAGHSRLVEAEPVSGLRVAAEALDFGEAWPQEGFQWILPVENRTQHEMRIVKLIPSCGCAAVEIEPRPLVIRPGETSPLCVTLDLLTVRPDSAVTEFRDMDVHIAVQLEGELPAAGWLLRGRVHNPYALSPHAVEFSETIVRGVPFPSREVRVSGHVALASLRAESEPDLLDIAVSRGPSREAGFLCRLTPKESLPLGRFRALVLLHGVTRDGTTLPAVPFPVSGTVVSDIRAVPSLLTEPTLAPGSLKNQTFMVRSASGRRFSVDDVTASMASVTIEPAATTMAATHEFRVSTCFSQPGHQHGELRLTVADEFGNRSALLVPFYGYCLAADLPGGADAIER